MMKTYGLTGGIGMGKSAAGRLLAQRGIPVIDTDDLARELVEPGQPALLEIEKTFGAAMLDSSGRLRRGELAQIVFKDPAARKTLESILHPRIRSAWQDWVQDLRAKGCPHALVVIPLLFETSAADLFDAVICVACSAVTQRRRLQERGWSEQQIRRRLSAQWPVERKLELSNYVVWSEGGLDALNAQLLRVIP